MSQSDLEKQDLSDIRKSGDSSEESSAINLHLSSKKIPTKFLYNGLKAQVMTADDQQFRYFNWRTTRIYASSLPIRHCCRLMRNATEEAEEGVKFSIS